MKFQRRHGIAVWGVVIILLIVGLAGIAYQAWSYYVTDQRFNNTIGGYFDLADQSSNATVKLHYWNLFASALAKNHLDTGAAVHGGIFCWGCETNPEFNLTNSYNANVLTTQSRLQGLVSSCAARDVTCQNSFSYTSTLQQIETTEICWFPINYFKTGYEIQQGLFASGLSRPSNDYLCSTTTKT